MNKGFQSFEKMYLHLWTYMKLLVPVLMDLSSAFFMNLEDVNEKLQELSKEELEKVTGGQVQICHIGGVAANADISDAAVTWQGKTAGRVETSATGQSRAVKPDRFR